MKVTGGSVIKLEKDKSNGQCRKWRLSLYVDGKQKMKRFNGKFRDAQVALREWREDLENTVINEQTFGGYADSWLEYRKASGNFQVGTLENDRNLSGVLKREFGSERLDSLTPERCRKGLVNLKNGGSKSGNVLSGTYMNSLFVTFHQILRQAHDDGKIALDPLAKVDAPKCDTKEKEWLSPAELLRFIDNLSSLPLDGRTACCYLIAYLGLRRGEACGLLCDDIDLSKGIVHVKHAVKERNGKIGETKTNAGRRDLPIPDGLSPIIEQWLSLREEWGYKCPSFACSSVGTVMRPQNLQRWWDKNKDGLGASGMGLHQIRHSNLSMMARYMNVFDLQRWAGWSSIEPAKIYVHADAESLKKSSSLAFQCQINAKYESRPEN